MQWFLFALLSALFASLVSIFAKIGMKGIDSNLATFFRILVILPFAFLLVFIQGTLKDFTKFTPTTWIFLILSGLATGLSWLFYFRALQIGDVSKVVPIDKLSFVFAIVLGIMIFKERITGYGMLGISLLLAGTYLIAFK